MTEYDLLINKENPLPPNYIPIDLIRPDIPFAEEETPTSSEKFLLRREAAFAIGSLFTRARSQGVHLYGVSGYRSFARQKEIYEDSLKKRGLPHTENYIAYPGTSEHQTGLAMDVSIPSLNFALEESFGNTKEGKFLSKFAPLYGFIIRYPKGVESITGYEYEPWHIRYVTKPLAIFLSKTHMTLEEYHRKH